jgi:hypothetical protein
VTASPLMIYAQQFRKICLCLTMLGIFVHLFASVYFVVAFVNLGSFAKMTTI